MDRALREDIHCNRTQARRHSRQKESSRKHLRPEESEAAPFGYVTQDELELAQDKCRQRHRWEPEVGICICAQDEGKII